MVIDKYIDSNGNVVHFANTFELSSLDLSQFFKNSNDERYSDITAYMPYSGIEDILDVVEGFTYQGHSVYRHPGYLQAPIVTKTGTSTSGYDIVSVENTNNVGVICFYSYIGSTPLTISIPAHSTATGILLTQFNVTYDFVFQFDTYAQAPTKENYRLQSPVTSVTSSRKLYSLTVHLVYHPTTTIQSLTLYYKKKFYDPWTSVKIFSTQSNYVITNIEGGNQVEFYIDVPNHYDSLQGYDSEYSRYSVDNYSSSRTVTIDLYQRKDINDSNLYLTNCVCTRKPEFLAKTFTQRFEFTNSIGMGWKDPTASGASIVVITNTATKLVFDAYLSGDASNTVIFNVTAKSPSLLSLFFYRSPVANSEGVTKYKVNIRNPESNPTVTYHIDNCILTDGTLVSGGTKTGIDIVTVGPTVKDDFIDITYTYTLDAEGYDTYVGRATVRIPKYSIEKVDI